jgi:hypothetical protein
MTSQTITKRNICYGNRCGWTLEKDNSLHLRITVFKKQTHHLANGKLYIALKLPAS